MILETVLGGVLGTVSRLAPEVIGFLDKKNERKHELALGDQQYRVAELQFRQQTAIKDLDVEQAQFGAAMQALQESIKAQSVPSGIKWIDGLTSLIRPTITFWIFGLYSMVKIAALSVALETKQLAEAVLSIWGGDDAAMLSTVVMFWFVGRVWDKRRSKSE